MSSVRKNSNAIRSLLEFALLHSVQDPFDFRNNFGGLGDLLRHPIEAAAAEQRVPDDHRAMQEGLRGQPVRVRRQWK